MRWILGLLLVVFIFLVGTAFFGSMGYAAGGGVVQLFPKWAESHSESGVAIAVYENQGQITTENTPLPRPDKRSPLESALPIFVLIGIALGGLIVWYFDHKSDEDGDWESDTNFVHFSAKEAEEYKRTYGPD